MAIFFTHIPKTGGSSLQVSLVEANLEAKEIYSPQGYRDLLTNSTSFQCLVGHHPYGIHRFNSATEKPIYFTMLRDPVERVISFYYECLWPRPFEKVSKHPEHARAWESDLIDFCRMYRFRNVQTRMVAGMLPTRLGKYMSVDISVARDRILTAAKRHLEQNYIAFGITERFEESRTWISKSLDWEVSPIEERRAAYPDRPSKDDLPVQTVESLRNLNALDIELYEFATRRFEERVTAEGHKQ